MSKCSACGKPTKDLVPDPRDSKQEILVCVDCEYAITASYVDIFEEQPTDYRSASHGA